METTPVDWNGHWEEGVVVGFDSDALRISEPDEEGHHFITEEREALPPRDEAGRFSREGA